MRMIEWIITGSLTKMGIIHAACRIVRLLTSMIMKMSIIIIMLGMKDMAIAMDMEIIIAENTMGIYFK